MIDHRHQGPFSYAPYAVDIAYDNEAQVVGSFFHGPTYSVWISLLGADTFWKAESLFDTEVGPNLSN